MTPSLDSECGQGHTSLVHNRLADSHRENDAYLTADSSGVGSARPHAFLPWSRGRLWGGSMKHRVPVSTASPSYTSPGKPVFGDWWAVGRLSTSCMLRAKKSSRDEDAWSPTQLFRTLSVLFVGAAALTFMFTLKGLEYAEPTLETKDTSATRVTTRLRSDSLLAEGDVGMEAGLPAAEEQMFSSLLGGASPPTSRALLTDDGIHVAMERGGAKQNDWGDPTATVGVPSPRRARVGYLVMTSGMEELQKTKRLLTAIYDPDNFYMVHLDRKSGKTARLELEEFIRGWSNVRMLLPALDVSWGGYTITLTAIFGICAMVQWSDEWDFFVNLSASDFPLLPQDELTEVLGRYAEAGLNFVEGAPLNERNRVEVLIDDQGLYREVQSSKAGRPLKLGKPRLPPSKSMFTVYKGEFWVILHRSFCQYIEASPDNVARSLQAYFSRFRISDESYFQTVLCHPQAPSFPVYKDNLRFVSWPEVSEGYYVLHPDPITGANVHFAMASGALFARKFDHKESQEAYTVLEEHLAAPNEQRLARSVQRLEAASHVVGRKTFCAIPEGYSIQEVLSRPPKSAMEKQKARKKIGGSHTGSSAKAAPQTRETMEGKNTITP